MFYIKSLSELQEDIYGWCSKKSLMFQSIELGSNSIEYKRDVGLFYSKYFREHISNEENESIHEDIWFVLGIFLSNMYSFPK